MINVLQLQKILLVPVTAFIISFHHLQMQLIYGVHQKVQKKLKIYYHGNTINHAQERKYIMFISYSVSYVKDSCKQCKFLLNKEISSDEKCIQKSDTYDMQDSMLSNTTFIK